MDDHELLRDYAERRSEHAFARLVERHLPVVYATALRLAGNASVAEDVAQSVFIDLSRKAWMVRPGTLPGWLYRATQRAAYMALRTENRRRRRETMAVNLAEQNQDSSAAQESLLPLLDDALRQLNRVEQDALLLRYFDGKSVQETGRLLSLGEAATQKRISRALEKMRGHFARQGINATGALLATTLGTHAAVPPPAGLAEKITGPSLAGAAGGAGLLTATALRILFMSTKTKIALAVAALAVIAFVASQFFPPPAQPAAAPAVVAHRPAPVPQETKIAVASPSPAPLPPPQPLAPEPPPPASPAPPPEPVMAATPPPPAEPPTPPAAGNPQLDLHSALTDIVDRFRTGDLENTIKDYLPPNLTDAQKAEVNAAIAAFLATPDSHKEISEVWTRILGNLVENMSEQVLNRAGSVPRMRLSFQLARFPDVPQVDKDKPGHIYLLKDKGVWYIEEFNQGDFSIDLRPPQVKAENPHPN